MLEPLSNGKIITGFKFENRFLPDAPRDALFPRTIKEMIQHFHIKQLHLSFTQGSWDRYAWGVPFFSVDNPSGVELWATLEHQTNRSTKDTWKELTNSLAGYFCASLNFMNEAATTEPQLAFPRTAQTITRYALLPRELVCTENLTPWLKLLPCLHKASLMLTRLYCLPFYASLHARLDWRHC